MEERHPIDDALLDRLVKRLKHGETVDLEVKRAKGRLPKEIWPTVSAFANTNGGWIILGMSEVAGGGIEITGVENPEAQIQQFFDVLHNANKVSAPIVRDEEVGTVSHGAARLVIIRVPAAPRKSRPVYINNLPVGGTYVRKHEGDYRCTDAEVKRLMREASDADADATILKGFGIEDLDQEAIARFRRRDDTQNPDSHRPNLDQVGYLKALNAYRRDRSTGREGITVAGLLLFGTMAALRDWRIRHRIDFRIRDSADGEQDRWRDRILWDGHLFGAYETIFPKLVADLPVPFQLVNGVRVTQTAAHVAMREAFVNLLVHADYSERESSLIIRDERGCYFKNPGDSRVRHLDIIAGNRSDPRNPNLVAAFRFIGLAEDAGSGIPNIVRAWKELGFETPDIDVGTERYEFQLRLARVHLIAEQDRAWMSQLGDVDDLNAQLALAYAREHGRVDNAQLRTITGLLPRVSGRILTDLRDKGHLVGEGSGRYVHYCLSPALQQEVAAAWAGEAPTAGTRASATANPAATSGTNADSLGSKPSSLEDRDASLEDRSTSLEDSDASLEGNAERLKDNEASSAPQRPDDFNGTPIQWWEMTSRTAEVRQQRRVKSASAFDAAIVAACDVHPASLRDIIALTGRSRAYVRQALRKLVASGKLSHVEKSPTHPNQRYSTSGDVDQGRLFGG